MIKGGYILQPRSFDGSAAAKMPPCAREVWLYLLRNVNHKDNGQFKRGQGFFVMSEIMEALSWSVGYRKMTYSKTQVAKALRRLNEDAMTTTAKTTRGLVVTICNYDLYQTPSNYEDYSEDSTKTQRRPRGDYTINKNGKNERMKEDKKKSKKEKFDFESAFLAVWEKYPNKIGKKAALRHFKASVKNEADVERFNNALANYLLILARKTKEEREKYTMGGAKFFNNWEDEKYQNPPANGRAATRTAKTLDAIERFMMEDDEQEAIRARHGHSQVCLPTE